MESKAVMLRAVRDALNQRIANEQSSPTAMASSAPLDPSSCPKGKVMIDSATGKTVHCTGTADTTGAVWLSTLAQITHDPKGSKPKKVTPDSTENSVRYDYAAIGPFSVVMLSVYGGNASRWMLATKSTTDAAKDLSPKGSLTRLCRKGIATWYEIPDGPLAASFVSIGDRDREGMIDVTVWSREEMQAEKASDEARGAPKAATIRDRICAE
jgi:hypothetical protein